MEKAEKKKKRYPKNIRKRIRREKAETRRNELDPKKQKAKIDKLYKKLKPVV